MLGFSPLASAPIGAIEQAQDVGLNLVASDIVAAAPLLEQIALTQNHAVSVNSIETEAITIDSVAAEIKYNLALADLNTTPIVDSIGIVSQHQLVCSDITFGVPLVDNSTASILNAITVNSIALGSISIDSINLQEVYNFSANNLSATPVVDTINIVSVHSVVVNNLSLTPVIDNLNVNIFGAISVEEIVINPVVDSISIIQDHNITLNELNAQPVVDSTNVLVEHSLAAADLVATPVVESANVTPQQIVRPQKIVAGSVNLDSIAVQQLVQVKPSKIIATPRIYSLSFNQIHTLTSNEILLSAPIAPSVRFLWDFQQIDDKIWTEVSVIDDTWTVVRAA